MAPTDEALPEVLLTQASWLRRLARQLVRDAAEADDAVQETWLRVLQSREVRPHAPRAWLAGALRHVVSDRRRASTRARARNALLESPAPAQDPLDSLVAVERQRALLDLVLALPPEQRRALTLRYFEDLPPRTIAARERTSVHTIKSRMQRALAHLRMELEREHGSGGAWALWLLPLARGGRELARGGALLAASVTAALVVAGVAIALTTRPREPHASPPALQVASRAPGVEAPTAAEPRSPPADTRAPAVVPASGELLVHVVDERTGLPVPGAEVHAAGPDDYDVELYPDIERVCVERGLLARTDTAGLARIPGTGPRLVHASLGERVRLAGAEAGTTELVLELRSVPPLRVRVVDGGGTPVAGVPVAGGYELPREGSREADSPWWQLQRTTGSTGEAAFHDPLGLHSEAEPGASVRARWRHVRIDLPGFAERYPQASVPTPVAGDDPALLELGPAGELELQVLASDGSPAHVRGHARLTTPHAGDPGYHDAPIVDGKARWPRVAAGGTYEAKIVLPGEGAQWTEQFPGPASGARVVIPARRPPRPAVVAQIVDAQGRPVRTERLTLFLHGSPDPRSLGPFATDAEGRLRFELDAPPGSAAELEWTMTVHHLPEGKQTFARGTLPRRWGPGEHALGRITLSEAPLPLVRGRCIADDGTPLQGLHVFARMITGVTLAASSAADGSFELHGLFDERVRVEASDFEGVWFLRAPVEVSASAPEAVLEFTRAGSFRGRIALGALRSLASQVTLRWRADDGKYIAGGALTQEGDVVAAPLSSGLHRLELHLGHGASDPLAVVEGIQILAGQECGDARVDALDLSRLVRAVRVQAIGLEPRQELRLGLVGPQSRPHSLERIEGRTLLPRLQEARLFAGARGMLAQDLGWVQALPDEIEVTLRPGMRVELRPVGKLELQGYLTLELQGHPLWNDMPSLDGLERGQPLELLLPAPGTYRILRQTRSDAGGGRSMVSVASNTGLELVVEDLAGPQTLEVDLRRVR